jgi:tryptophan 2,3-dioxygenase
MYSGRSPARPAGQFQGVRQSVTVDQLPVSVYSSYLALDELLTIQRPRTNEPDEMLFIVVHQAHELWFKQVLQELETLQRSLTGGLTAAALATLHRLRIIFRIMTGLVDAMETMPPPRFSAFRAELGGSGFQSAQWREIEAVLGRRDRRALERYPAGGPDRRRIEAAMARPAVFDSFLLYLAGQGYPLPAAALRRDVSSPYEPSAGVQCVLAAVYRDDRGPAGLCERLLDLDEGVQEWRYRHAKMAERIIGDKTGTGGSTGAEYLRSTLFTPAFGDLWAVRDQL